MLFGPSKQEIKEAVEEAIRPKANIDDSFANLVGWTMDSDYRQYKLSTKCSKDMLKKPDFVNVICDNMDKEFESHINLGMTIVRVYESVDSSTYYPISGKSEYHGNFNIPIGTIVNRNGNWTYLPNDSVDDNGLMQYLMENKK